jgi:hypothetical protein
MGKCESTSTARMASMAREGGVGFVGAPPGRQRAANRAGSAGCAVGKIITRRRGARQSGPSAETALIERQRLRRREFAQFEFAVVVEQPVFHDLELTEPVQQFGRRRGQRGRTVQRG